MPSYISHTWCPQLQMHTCTFTYNKNMHTYKVLSTHTDRHKHHNGGIDPRVNVFLIAIRQCFGTQCMHMKTQTQVHVRTHRQTHCQRVWHAHIHTQVENTPDSGLRELTKRENPADISSPLKSTRNDDRIGLPMEMSPQWRAHTQTHTYKDACINTDTNIQKQKTHTPTHTTKWSVFARWAYKRFLR